MGIRFEGHELAEEVAGNSNARAHDTAKEKAGIQCSRHYMCLTRTESVLPRRRHYHPAVLSLSAPCGAEPPRLLTKARL